MRSLKKASLTLAAGSVLCLGILASLLTTSDTEWWRYYFSRLGMTEDFSSALFNGGVVAAGGFLVAAGVLLRVRLLRDAAADSARGRLAAQILPLLTVLLGASLACIGFFPISFSHFAHDRATNGVVLAFAALLISHRFLLSRPSRLLGLLALGTASALILGMAAMTLGFINLTVFEGIAFSSVLSWVHCLENHVKPAFKPRVKHLTANSQQHSLSPIWGTRKSALLSSHVAGATG